MLSIRKLLHVILVLVIMAWTKSVNEETDKKEKLHGLWGLIGGGNVRSQIKATPELHAREQANGDPNK